MASDPPPPWYFTVPIADLARLESDIAEHMFQGPLYIDVGVSKVWVECHSPADMLLFWMTYLPDQQFPDS